MPDQVEEKKAEGMESKKVMEILELWITREAQAAKFLVRSHPRGSEAIYYVKEKTLAMLREFVLNGQLPVVETISPDQIEKAVIGFWDSMAKKATTRQRAK